MTAPDSRSQPTSEPVRQHAPLPWFVSGVRFRMNGGEWHSINRYDEAKKWDENIACVGYDPRTGDGLADAHFIVEAANSYASLKARVEELEAALRPFAKFADRFGLMAREDSWQITQNPSGTGNLTMGDCRNARVLLPRSSAVARGSGES